MSEAQTTTNQPKLVKYELRGDVFVRIDPDTGDALRIARYDEETGNVGFFPDMARYRVPLTTHMNHKGYPVGDFTQLHGEEDKPKPIPQPENVPPRPKRDRRAGDKSPKLMEWLYHHRREEFNTRYGYVGDDPETGKPITRRKTPYSIAAQNVAANDDEYEEDPTL